MAAKRNSNSNNNNQSFSLRRIILQRLSDNRNQNQRTIDLENGTVTPDSTEKLPNNTETKCSPERTKTSSDAINFYNLTETRHEEDDNFCVICYLKESAACPFYTLELCKHRFCMSCLLKYLKNEINESRTDIACPQCSSSIHPNNIDFILKDFPAYKHKYEDFMIRRYLVADPDSRWCPAPDCSFAVIATGCASCPKIQCERPSCGVSFCYHCKAEWHPDQTCDAARLSRQNILRTSSISQGSSRRDEIKPCPRCQVLIVKMNDGSCNHMICSVCGAEFCWLCMKEVSDLHYLSPSGCTFWGKKPWSRKKKIVWQIGTLIGAPVGIALLAGIAIPSMVIGIPVWVGRKLFDRYKTKTRQKRNISVIIGVCASILISPILAGLAIAIGVPILLFYVYGIVPVSLCRAGCGSTIASDEYKFEVNIPDDDENRHDAIEAIGETSIGEVSLAGSGGSLIEGTSGSQQTHSHHHRPNVNSINSTHRESTLALAGSMKNQKLEYTDDMSTESTSVITCNSVTTSNMNDTNSAIALAGSIASSS